MSLLIDEKVVEMRFDNKQFESGVKESLNTLDKLKASLDLDESAKSFALLDKAANSVSFDGISSGIEALQKRFSTFGIVGMRVIENVTDSLMGMASNAISYVDNAIVSGGLKRAQNIENAHFQLQALLKDEEAVQAVMDNAMASVDGTAYAYDEAAKAASQFAASGMRAGDEMISALRAITGVAAMTNSEYEGISRIFTTVAGNGRLMGDQLLQLSSRGLNAAATIADYFREVQGQSKKTESDIREMVSDGQISFKTFAAAMDWAFGESAFRANETFTGALSNMRSALARIGAEFFSPLIEQNSDLILLINTMRERINDVKKALTFNEQQSAISGLKKITGLTTDAFDRMFNTIDKRGSVIADDLEELSSIGVNAARSLTNYINNVTSGTIRTTYATKTALNELTGGMQVSETQVREFVSEGKINLDIFTSAMETAYGDQEALSKQFTDNVLDMAKTVSEYLKNLDLSKPLSLVYYGTESVKNVLKGLYSVAKPAGKAFSKVFLKFNIDDVIELADKIETLTSKMKLSERQSEDLQDAFTGVFSIVKLLLDAVFGLVGVVIPAGKPITSFADLIIRLSGAMGRGLSTFSGWINNSPRLNKAYDSVASSVQKAMTNVAKFIDNIDELVDYIYKLPIVQRISNKVIKSFNNIYEQGGTYLTFIIQKIKEFSDELKAMVPEEAKKIFDDFIDEVKLLGENLDTLDIEDVTDLFHKFMTTLKELLKVLSGNTGINTFVKNMKEYFQEMSEAFTSDALFSKIDRFKEKFGGFIEWFIDKISPLFDNFSFGGAVATASGLGIIYSIAKVTKVIDKLSTTAVAFPKLLDAVKNTLVAYQKDLKADAILKIAKAITLLAIGITVLSFADSERAYKSAIVLALVGGALSLAVGYFTEKKGIVSSLSSIANAVKWKQIGKGFKNMALALAIFVASIAGLAYLYSKDPDNINRAFTAISAVGIVMIGLIAIMSALGNKISIGMKAFGTAATGVMMLAASLFIIVGALNKLFNLEIPSDLDTRMSILGGIFVALAGLTIVVALASKIASSKGFYSSSGNSSMMSTSKSGSVAGSILGLVAALYLTVLALERLFKMDIPSDYEQKFTMLTAVFGGLIIAILAFGIAGKMSKGGMKGAGTILAMCLAIATIVGALAILSLFPGKKLLSGAITLGVALIALSVSLAAAGKIAGKESWKSIIAMSMLIGVVVAALGALSMISESSLTKSVIALGAVLLLLAVDFVAISKISDKLSYITILALAAMAAIIAVSLYTLANHPWDQMLAAASALSMVLLTLSGAFAIMTAVNPNFGTLLGFVGGILALAAIGYILSQLAVYPWKNMLAAASALSMVLLSITVAMAVCAGVGTIAGFALVGMLLLDLFIGNLLLILYGLGHLSDEAEEFLDKGGNILKKLGDFLGDFIENIISGIGRGIGNSLSSIGTGLSDFANNSKDFFDVMDNVDESVLNGVVALSKAILVLTAAEMVNNINTFLGGKINMSSFGESLKSFGTGIADFAKEVKGVSSSDVETASNCALALAGLYSNLPKEGGWMQKITGEQKSLAEFAAELIPFGMNLAIYSATVKGKIDQAAVEASIKAAEVIFAFADKLPDMGGLAGKIFGNQKTLAEFAEEFTAFGNGMVEYSDTVTATPGISKEAIEASINAAEILLVFNEKLPDMGGLKQVIFGHQKTLAEFAEEFIPFGNAMVSYCETVAGKIDKPAVEASTEAASLLAGLADTLTGSSGIASWFSRDTNLDDFGKQLKKFGQGLSDYSESIKDINTTKLNAVIAEVQALIDIANLTASLNVSGMTEFSDALKKMGDKGISEFIQSFNDSIPKVKDTVDSMVKSANDRLTNGNDTLSKMSRLTGENVALYLRNGVTSKQPLAFSAIQGLCSTILNRVTSTLSNSVFMSIGQSIMINLENGINSRREYVLTSAGNAARAILNTVNSNLNYSEFYSIGSNVGAGLGDGINSKINDISNAAINAARAAINTAKTELQVKSPSRVFIGIGENVAIGMANGISNNVSTIKDASSDLVDSVTSPFRQVVDQISDLIENGIDDYNPVIRPVIDLSYAEQGVSDISAMFQRMNLSTTASLANNASTTFNRSSSSKGKINEENENLGSELVKYLKNQEETPKIENHNVFNIKSTDPKEAAEEIDYIMQRQVERRKATWAR